MPAFSVFRSRPAWRTPARQALAPAPPAPATAARRQISDADGFDLKPNPLTAATPPEFVAALRQYRAWSGNPSFRTMAQRAEQLAAYSTMHAAMSAEALPRLEVVKAIVIG